MYKNSTNEIYILYRGVIMDNLNNFFNNCNLNEIDINKLLVILLLLTDQLQIEAIHVYRNNFVVSLGTFIQR
ncbi:hypothetical protein D3C76_1842480 [compost metagenome]